MYNLVRYLYIVEQQYQSDNDETRTKTIEIFNDYLAQFRQSDEVIEEEEEEEEENNQQSNEPQSTPITTFNPVRIFYFMTRSLLPFNTRSLKSDRLLNGISRCLITRTKIFYSMFLILQRRGKHLIEKIFLENNFAILATNYN